MTEVNIFSNRTWDLSFLTSQQKHGQTPLQGTCHCCGPERERWVDGAQVVPLKYLLLDFKAAHVV